MDSRPSEQPEGSYAYGKNGVIDYLTETIRNEPGIALLSAVVPYTLNGVIETDDRPVLFSTDNTNSAIGFFNPATQAYDPIVNDNPANLVNWPNNGDRLGFKLANYITGESQRNYRGQLIVGFTDKVTFPKYLNCDAPNIKALTDLRLFPFFKTPLIDLYESTGGNVPAGTYYVAVSYERNDGTVTPKSDVSSGITISPGSFTSLSEKSITITITGADTNYDFIRVYVIAVSDGKTSVKELTDVVPVSSGIIEVLYTGNNLSQEVSLSEVLTPGAVYSTIGTLGQLNDSLYGADLKSEEEITDMQPYASQVVLNFKSDLISTVSPPPEHIQGKKKGLMHEEVYAVYIRYRLISGGFTKAFLTVGQAAVSGDLVNSTEATAGGYGAVPKYKVEDTVRAFTAGTLSGIPGTWLNSVEKYPLDPTNAYGYNSIPFGGTEDLRGFPVRHHKMPTLRWCKQNLYFAEPNYGISKLDLLGLFATNIIIPPKYTNIITGYQLLYAKRSPATTLIQAQGAMLHPVTTAAEIATPDGTAQLYTSGGNFGSQLLTRNPATGTYVDTRPDQAIMNLRLSAMRFHAFDLLFNKPGITPSLVSGQYKMSQGTVGYIENANLGVGGSKDGPITLLVDYTNVLASPIILNTTGNKLRKINQSFYLPNGVNIAGFVNIRHETCFAGFLAGSNWSLTNSSAGYSMHEAYTATPQGYLPFEEAYLINLLSVKQDVYAGFQNQVLIAAGTVRDVTDTGITATFFTGDTFACDYSFHTYGRYDSTDFEGDGIRGRKVIRRISCESVSNIHLRYEIPGNIYSKWYPRFPAVANASGSISYVRLYDRSIDPNQFGYSKSLNALNEFISTTPFNPFVEIFGIFPFRIHRFGKVSRQGKFRNWRTALPLDYYECQKNMGRIINLDSLNDRLIIHHENALFVTQDKAKLEGGGLVSVTIGSGDIFQFEPQMVVDSKLGYGGTQHELSCVKIPPGYVFADVKLNMFFMYSGGKLIDLGDKDLSIFLQQYLTVTGKNNYTGTGITIGWDTMFSRILFTVINSTPVFTLSYSMVTRKWAFFHDYFPVMYINTRKELFSANAAAGVSTIQKHNSAASGVFPTNGTRSFFIDVIFKSDTDLIAESIQWKTDVLIENTTDLDTHIETLTHIAIWNSHQHSGRVALQDYTALNIKDIRRTKGVWSFNSFRDILELKRTDFLDSVLNDFNLIGVNANKPWYDKELLSDTWFCVRFEFNNSVNRKVVLHDTALQAIKAPR